VSEYDEVVTVRVWDAQRGEFRNATEVDAYRKTVAGKVRFYVGGRATITATGKPTRGSEITDAAGVVYTVTRADGKQPVACHVEPKSLDGPE
jgi:hypothetical protein